MTLPANIRVNVSAPFPATVKGGGPVTVSKQNGIWTVGLQIANLAGLPGGTDLTTIELLLYNTITNSFAQATVASLLTSLPVNPTRIDVTNSPYAVQPTDTFLYVDTAGGPIEIDLSTAASRGNVPISIKDVTGHAAANNITIKPAVGETIDGYTHAAPLVLQANYDGVRLSPNTLSYVIAP